jgi:hypothetical protein
MGRVDSPVPEAGEQVSGLKFARIHVHIDFNSAPPNIARVMCIGPGCRRQPSGRGDCETACVCSTHQSPTVGDFDDVYEIAIK